MSGTVGVAVVGAGFMGGVHAAVLTEDPRARVRWIVDLDERAGGQLAAQMDARATTRLSEALADDEVRLVVVSTPVTTHHPVALEAIAAGRHVLVEKPLVMRPDHARELVAAAKAKGVLLGFGGNFVHAPKFRRAKELVADRTALGTLHAVRVVYRTSGPDSEWPRNRALAGGGACTDIGWHAIELCSWLLGEPRIEAVTAATQNITGVGDVEEQGVMLLHFEGGAVGQCDVSWLCPGGEQLTVEVLGTEGRVSVDFWQGMGITAFTTNKFAEVWEPNQGWAFPEWEWIRNSGYVQQDRSFVDAIVNGEPLGRAADSAIPIVSALDAVYRSAAEGRKIEIHD
ncbi:Gfo/Idh/MocA family oxidoreductase [Microtetraspora sp. NBRC 13810]|uniref:Gfo/Idh/MocA family protein n=1 Tax=Microtetraspora sp. NBRC 13810 TaxID=3030990 RepID=UPI0025575DBD|nr:Gfo/Idh/MocA family oxidoreductase [Microtetraspora sp. NBRC 13810]